MSPKLRLVNVMILLIILAAGTVSFFFSQGSTYSQFIIVLMTSIAYAGWGLLYHRLRGDLHLKVVVEYVLVSAIAVILMFIVLFS